MIGDQGYAVTLGRAVVAAVHLESGERFMVRGSTLYDAAYELAGQVAVLVHGHIEAPPKMADSR